MIYLYEGTPGSGKSFHATNRIYTLLREGKINVISNYPVDIERVYMTKSGYKKFKRSEKGKKVRAMVSKDYTPVIGHYDYWENSQMTVERFVNYCYQHHKYREMMMDGVPQRAYFEDQTLIIIDEAQILFNCRDFGDRGRMEWCKFFSQHRHYGFNFILIAQHERMLDRQIRYLIEVFVQHRNLKYFNIFAKILSLIAGGSLFIYLYRWQGCKDIMSRDFSRYKLRIASIYNSYLTFDSKLGHGSDAGRGSLRPNRVTASDKPKELTKT